MGGVNSCCSLSPGKVGVPSVPQLWTPSRAQPGPGELVHATHTHKSPKANGIICSEKHNCQEDQQNGVLIWSIKLRKKGRHLDEHLEPKRKDATGVGVQTTGMGSAELCALTISSSPVLSPHSVRSKDEFSGKPLLRGDIPFQIIVMPSIIDDRHPPSTYLISWRNN